MYIKIYGKVIDVKVPSLLVYHLILLAEIITKVIQSCFLSLSIILAYIEQFYQYR